jgi:hypothetical protein
MADYSDPLGLLFGGVDYFDSPQKSKGLLQLTPQEIERMAAAQSPAFGVFPQMQPYRSQQDITASANVPVDVVRGRIAGTRGLFGDVVNQPIPMIRPLQLLSQALTGQQKYPDTEYYLDTMPLKSDTPIGDVAGRIGSFAPINPMPAVRGAQKLGGLLGEEMATRLNTGKPLLPSLLAEPQTAMFAVEPNPSMAMADESSAMRQQLTDKMQALLAQKKIATSVVDVGSINQQIGELQAQFKSLPAMGRVAREVVVPEITAPVSNLGFYSATEQAAMNLERSKGTGQSFLNDLMNAPDVKNYEIEAMGLDTYLKGKPNVTRQEVQDFIQNNKINVEERQLGGTVTEDPLGIAKRKEIFDRYEPQIQAMYREMDNPTYKLVDRQVGPEEYQRGVILQNRVYRGEEITAQEQSELDSIMNRINGVAIREFPSVEEARKFYLSMSPDDKFRHSIMPVNSSTELQDKINKLQYIRDTEANAAYVVPEPTPTEYERYQLAGGENYRELLLTLPEKTPKTLPEGYSLQSMANGNFTLVSPDNIGTIIYAKSKDDAMEEAIRRFTRKEEPYRSSHFPDPNILAHMRVNDRIDAEGKKMLLIEEVQSDWHQAGRERGYGPKIERIVEAYYETKDGQRVPIGYGKTKEEAEANIDVGWKNTVDIKYETSDRKVGEGVPDAPFKDTWYQLALKRAIKEAVDKGYDRIGLTTGKQQAARYDLSKQVDEIAVPMVDADGSRSVRIDPTEGTSIKLMVDSKGVVTGYGAGSTQFSGKKLDEVIGKEIAEKVMNAEANAKFSGLDLQVGGEGMKKYYDEIYPNFLNKYGKKYGAQVGETEIGLPQKTSSSWAYFRDWFAENHSDVGSSATALSNWEKGSNNKYVKEFEKFRKTPTQKETVRYLDITPEMKKAVQKGQPLAAVEGMTGLLA